MALASHSCYWKLLFIYNCSSHQSETYFPWTTVIVKCWELLFLNNNRKRKVCTDSCCLQHYYVTNSTNSLLDATFFIFKVYFFLTTVADVHVSDSASAVQTQTVDLQGEKRPAVMAHVVGVHTLCTHHKILLRMKCTNNMTGNIKKQLHSDYTVVAFVYYGGEGGGIH